MTHLPRLAAGLAALTLAVALPGSSAAASSDPDAAGRHDGSGRATLTGFAALPAATFVPASDPSGSLLGTAPINGITPPFADQPVQGFSGIARNDDGSFDVLSDNGYGNKANSADFVLRIHRIIPDFAGHGVDVVGGINLTDPAGHVPFPLTRADRVLTGSDFDVESIVKAADGSYWIGDEFGPYLLHADRAGRLLAPPVPLADVHAPESAALLGVPANLPGSKGFEGMAASVDGRYLYPLLEGTVAGDTPGALRIYQIDLRDRDRSGTADKTLVADLLDLADPRHLGGAADTFRFPFQTIEDVVILDDRTLGVLNDNNFPFSSGRTAGLPDDDEFTTIALDRSLRPDPRVLR